MTPATMPLAFARFEPVALTIVGAPRTKKTSNVVIYLRKPTKSIPSGWCGACRRGALPRVLPSDDFEAYEKLAVPQLRQQFAAFEPVAHPVNVAAVFYRERAIGDLVGYMQALADVLQAAGVVVNDRWIVSWDGTRLDKSAERPRVELVISEAV